MSVKCQDLSIPWVHFNPLISTRDVGVHLLRRHNERSWRDVVIVAISWIHVTLDVFHSSIEIGVWARQECIYNVSPVGLSIICMAIFDDGLEMALYLLSNFDNIAFLILNLGSLNCLAMKFQVDWCCWVNLLEQDFENWCPIVALCSSDIYEH